MTPDMRRLCEAANVPLAAIFAGEEVSAEAIVRAVLMELREVSPEMAKAGGEREVPHYWGDDCDDNVKIGSWAAETAFPAMIDHILAEPTEA